MDYVYVGRCKCGEIVSAFVDSASNVDADVAAMRGEGLEIERVPGPVTLSECKCKEIIADLRAQLAEAEECIRLKQEDLKHAREVLAEAQGKIEGLETSLVKMADISADCEAYVHSFEQVTLALARVGTAIRAVCDAATQAAIESHCEEAALKEA